MKNLKMQYIYPIDGGYWVRFTKNGQEILMTKCFFASHCKGMERALTLAKIWRNQQFKLLLKKGRYIGGRLMKHWCDHSRFHIVGLSWVERTRGNHVESFLTAYTKNPADKKCIYRRRSLQKYELKGAFNLVIKELQSMRTITYPEKVKKEAFKRLKIEFNRYSILEYI